MQNQTNLKMSNQEEFDSGYRAIFGNLNPLLRNDSIVVSITPHTQQRFNRSPLI